MENKVEGNCSPVAPVSASTSENRGKIRDKNTIRTLTVSTVHRESGGSMRIKHSWVPALRLNGQWLGRLGFAPGQKVELKIGQGTIVITSICDASGAGDEEAKP